ncbi:DUF6510 family protein [Rathayibacter sp. KR2-224]|uniref:DUF6510 family protein n=1 Tax=Rathayibacter sp. KR2-224 TaxID=3400913 RepID=UPI003C1257DC
MQKFDGNVLAGPLSEVMAGDATAARARCAHCGDVAVVAQAVVYADGNRFVARCRRCDGVLLTIIEADGEVRLTMTGVTAYTIPT